MSNDIELKSNKYEMLKCVWMTSGVIEYKLCDNNFDCENCPFDKVMRNLCNEKETNDNGIINDADTIFNKLQSIKYDDKIIYLKNSLIAKEICDNTFYLGLNPILINLLYNVNSVVINVCRKNISVGEQIIKINGDWGSVDISAPINLLIYNQVGDPADNSLKSEWFAIIGAAHQDVLSSKLQYKEWEKLRAKAIDSIGLVKEQVPKVGDTMLDGGSQIKFLHQIIGNENYIEILKSICT